MSTCCFAGGNWPMANLQFPCQLKQTAPLKESLWQQQPSYARSHNPPMHSCGLGNVTSPVALRTPARTPHGRKNPPPRQPLVDRPGSTFPNTLLCSSYVSAGGCSRPRAAQHVVEQRG